MARQPMPISSRWLQGAVLTYLVGFTVLGVLAYLVYRDQPPIPERVVAGDQVLFTRDDIVGGMHVFQRYGLMEYGSVYGHGAYLGPDFTAEYLHMSAEFLIEAYAGALAGGLSARERVAHRSPLLQVVVGIDVDDLIERPHLGVPEGPEFRVFLPQRQPFGIALFEFGHGPRSQGIGSNFVDHGFILQMTSSSQVNAVHALPRLGTLLAHISQQAKGSPNGADLGEGD